MFSHQSQDKCQLKLHDQIGKNPEAHKTNAFGTCARKQVLSHVGGGSADWYNPYEEQSGTIFQIIAVVSLPGTDPAEMLAHL